MGLTWDEKITAIMNRLRTPDSLPTFIPGQIDIPYYSRTDVELSLLEITQQKLREIPQAELDGIGSVAVSKLTMASGDAVPVNYINILAVAIKVLNTDTAYVPSVWQRPSQYRQLENMGTSPAYIACYTLYDGRFYFIGNSARVVWLIEPTLTVARTDAPIIPPIYDEECIDWVTKQMQITNYIPEGVV